MKYIVYLDTDGNVDGLMRCEVYEPNPALGETVEVDRETFINIENKTIQNQISGNNEKIKFDGKRIFKGGNMAGKWSFEIYEIYIPEMGSFDQTIKVRFKVLKDDVWQLESNSQVEIPMKDFENLEKEAQDNMIKTKVREKMANLVNFQTDIMKLKRFEKYRFGLIDEGADDPVPGDSKQ